MTNFYRLLAVCCELREGLKHHEILKNCEKVGEFLSSPEFTLIEVDNPNQKVGLKEGSNSVVFEVYNVNFSKLDEVSKFKNFYHKNYLINFNEKIEIETPFGKAFTYLEKRTKITKQNIIIDYDYKDYSTYKIK